MQQIPLTAFWDVRSTTLTPMIGWKFEYNINSKIVTPTVAGSGSITQSNSKAVLQTGAATGSSAEIRTTVLMHEVPALGILVRFGAVFTTGVAGSTQIIGFGDDNDGLFFGYNGATFGALHRQNGVDMWITQSSWNGECVSGYKVTDIVNPTKGNVYAIHIQAAGFGNIQFMIVDPSSGESIVVHTLEYTNSDTDPNIFCMTLPLLAKVINSTNATNIQLETPVATAFIEGGDGELSFLYNNAANSKTGITTETAILTIKNKTTFASKTNKVHTSLHCLSVATEGTKPIKLRFVKNATLGGTPSYTDVDTDTSIMQCDTAGTTVTGGTTSLNLLMAKSDTLATHLKDLNLYLNPGDTMTIAASSAEAAEVHLNLNWIEEF